MILRLFGPFVFTIGITPQGWTTLLSVDTTVYTRVVLSYGIAGGSYCNSYVGCTCTYDSSEDEREVLCEECELTCLVTVGKPLLFATIDAFGSSYGLNPIFNQDNQTGDFSNLQVRILTLLAILLAAAVVIFVTAKKYFTQMPRVPTISALLNGPNRYTIIEDNSELGNAQTDVSSNMKRASNKEPIQLN